MNPLAVLPLAVFLALPVSAQAPSSREKSCCLPPQEVLPKPPRRRALCKGAMWSSVKPGRCEASEPEAAAGLCRDDAFTTLATVREYMIYWDERQKSCVSATTGRVNLVPVATCDGDSC